MALNKTQRVTLKADIDATSALVAFAAVENFAAIASYYNAATATNAWRSEAPVSKIYDSINWTLYTPTDVPSLSDLPAASALFLNRATVINIKQMNLQNILVGRSVLDCTNAGTRAGLRDAVIQVPAGTSGANVSPGGSSGVTTLTACTRPALKVETLFMSAPVTTGTVSAVVLAYEGTVSEQQVSDAWNNL